MKRSVKARLAGILVAVAVIAAAVLVVGGSALSPSQSSLVAAAPLAGMTYSSSFQVQNLETTAVKINVQFYDATTGLPVGSPAERDIPGGQSTTFLTGDLPVSPGFVGSAVIRANGRVAAISNEAATSGSWEMRGSHDGVRDTSTGSTMYVPSAMKGNGGFNSTVYVQNATQTRSDSTNTRLEFRDTNNNLIATDTPSLIKQGATYALPLSSLASLGTKFVGSIKITSDQPLAVAVNHTDDIRLYSTTAFPGGAQKIFAPLIMTDNAGWNTDIQVMNVGGAAATVVLKKNGTQVVGQKTLQQGQSDYWLAPLPGTTAGSKWYGSYSVEGTSPSDSIIGIVNERHTSGQSMSYKMFTGGTNKVFAPLIMSNNSGWWTDFQVMNVGTSDAVVDLKKNGTEIVATVTIPGGGSKTWLRPLPGTNDGSKWYGAFLAEGRGASDQLVGIVNQQMLDGNMQPYASGDYSMVYEATNQ